MGVLSYCMVKAAMFVKMDKVDITYVEHDHSLSDTEIEHYNKIGFFDKKIGTDHKFNEVFVRKLKITRIKRIFGWTTKIDTIETYERSEIKPAN